MMNNNLRKELIQYYDERAGEYDEIYKGLGPAIPDSNAYREDVDKIIEIVLQFGNGQMIDIGSGAGFWLPYYEKNCMEVSLIDESEKMLSQCKERVNEPGLKKKCNFIRGDFFSLNFKDQMFDSAVAGFFISHLTLDLEKDFFERLKNILKPGAKFLLIDSAWSRKRSKYREKEGVQERTLNDGRKFTIYKRYFDGIDIKKMFKKYYFKLESFYMGEVFLAAVGENKVEK